MTTTRELPVWRSLLYVPVNVEKFVDKAHTRSADAITLDIEDSVPVSAKAEARKLVEAAAKRVRRAGADVVVRINRPIAMAVRDLEAAICPDVDAVAVTKVEGAVHLRLLDELISELEAKRGMLQGHTRLIAMIEGPQAFARIDEIGGATPRIAAMNIGGEDFALACDMQPDDDVLLHPKQRMIIAAKAAGVMPLGFIGTVADFSDWDKFRAMVRRSARFGFMGAGCIHPGQVRIVNEAYSPSAAEVAYARKVIALNQEAEKTGRGSFQIDGKMIDIPIVIRAERLLKRHAAIEARQARAAALAG